MSQTARFFNIKQYSNIILFEKKAHDFKTKKKALFHSKIKKNKKLKSGILLKTAKNSSFSFPLMPNSTKPLFSDLNTQIFTGIKLLENSLSELKNKNDLKQNQNENKKSIENNDNKNKTFLTDSIRISSYRKKSDYNNYNNVNSQNNLLISTIKKSPNKSFFLNNNKNNINLSMNKNFSKIDNANILLFFQKEKNNNENNNNSIKVLNKKIRNKLFKDKKANSSDLFKKMIERKLKLIDPNKVDLNSYIEETKDYSLTKHTNLMKKENYKRSQENKINILEYYNDMQNNLEKKKKLLNIQFIEKMGDYIKFINSQKEIEKVKNSNLINIIIELKNEIKQLNKNISKKIQYKKNILKWIYFQIQLKEKKIKLPSYYRTILENNETKKSKIENKSKYTEEKSAIRKEHQRKHYSIEIRTSKKYFTRRKQKKTK